MVLQNRKDNTMMTRLDFLTAAALLGLLTKEPLVDAVSGELDPDWFAKAAVKVAEKTEKKLCDTQYARQKNMNDIFSG